MDIEVKEVDGQRGIRLTVNQDFPTSVFLSNSDDTWCYEFDLGMVQNAARQVLNSVPA